ncbi:MAG: glycine-rich protein, partial [Bacteroidales bacterium]
MYGIQEFQLPSSGMYRITASGAAAGTVPNNDPGYGAVMSGDFILTGNTTLNIIVGQKGGSSTTSFDGGGGGGGSFVWDVANTSQPLIAAGGGGAGGNQTGTSASKHATDSIDGQPNGNGDPGGSNGQGGPGGNTGSWGGGGGAGWLSNGGDDGTYGKGGFSPLNGGQGGPNTGSSNNEGGFGGGGSDGYDGGGGGGGYSGGHGGGYSGHTFRNGGGGGSYNQGTDQQNQGGVNDEHGFVVIEPLSSGAHNDAGIASLDEPVIFCPGTRDVMVTISNFGINQVNSVDVEWEINGVAQPTYTHTSTIDTMGGSGSSSAQVTIGSYTFTNAPYQFKAWTNNPNNVQDTVNDNDTLETMIQSNLPAPGNLTVTDTTGTTVTFTWMGGSAAHSWIYVLVPAGDAPGTGIPVHTTSQSATASGLTSKTDYDLYVAELCPGGTDTSAWAGPVSFTTPFSCPPLAYCFTNAGAAGASGPSQSQLNSAYTGTNLDGLVTSNGGIQEFQLPSSGMYRITASGAAAGTVPNNDPGYGAVMSGDFILTGNTTLNIIVGQKG